MEEDKSNSLQTNPTITNFPQATTPEQGLFFNSFLKPNNINNNNIGFQNQNLSEKSVIPINSNQQIERILAHKFNEQMRQNLFLVKFKDKSYHELKWITPFEFGNQRELLNAYCKSNSNETKEPYFNQNYLIPQKILYSRQIKQSAQYFVKWTDLDYCHSTWVDENTLKNINQKFNHNFDIFADYHKRIKATPKGNSSTVASFYPILDFHYSKLGKELNCYQIDILNFLINSYCFSQNVLISDIDGVEVRLSVVNFLERIIRKRKKTFLIITDQISIQKWINDFNEWTNLSFFAFIGSKENLEVMKKYEFVKPFCSDNNDFLYPIYITTIENFVSFHRFFCLLEWDCIILDSTLREKLIFDKNALNSVSKINNIKYRVIMTPPLENIDPRVVWSWFNFVDKNIFHQEARFIKTFCTSSGEINLEKLNNFAFNHYEHLTKNNYELNEIFIKCPLTSIQEESIKTIYDPLLNEFTSDKNFIRNSYNLKKMATDVRKVLDHPFLIKQNENKAYQEKRRSTASNPYSINEKEIFIQSSGKLFVLDLLLKKFKSESKNVVILCQTLDAIELLEKYITKLYSYEKVDVFTRGKSRYDAITQFNDSSSRIFAFLLDAKAGYFSMKADSVIIYESEWNPKTDMFIANKILSLQSVKEVYRLVSEKSYEFALINNDMSVNDFDGRTDTSIEDEMIDKLINFGIEEIKLDEDSEQPKENNDLNRYISSENPEADFILNNYSLRKKYLSIKDLSDHIPIEKWEQINQEMKELNKTKKDKVDKKASKPSDSKKNSEEEENDNEIELSAEEEEFNENDFDDNEKAADVNGWTPKLIFHLFNLMLKYGLTSFKIYSQTIPLPEDEIRKVILIILYCLLSKEANREDHIILVKYLTHNSEKVGLNVDEDNFDKTDSIDFVRIHQKEINKITSPNIEWKLNRLELLHIVDMSYQARKISNGRPTIPSFRQSSLNNDLTIMELMKTKGYPITKLPASLASTKMTVKKANKRVVDLADEIKSLFIDYCGIYEVDEELTPEKLLKCLKMLNIKEKKKVFQAIQMVGIDNLSLTFEASKLKKEKFKIFSQFIDQFKKFAHSAIKYKKLPCDFFGVHYSLRIISELVFDIAILKYVRETNIVESMPSQVRPALIYLKENGYKNIQKQPEIMKLINGPNQTIEDYLRTLFNDKKKTILNYFFKSNDSGIISPTKKDNVKSEKKSPEIKKASEKKVKSEESEFKYGSLLRRFLYSNDAELPKDKIFSDEEIAEVLPIKINDNTIITNIGKVISDRPNFHNDRYLYLAGFTSERYYISVHDPNKKEWYICRIIDKGEEFPLFTIECKNNPSIKFSGNVPSRPSIELLTLINSIRNKVKKGNKSPTISGPEFFAFASPKIRKLMAHLPGASKCLRFNDEQNENYTKDIKKVKFEETPEKRKRTKRKEDQEEIVYIDDYSSSEEEITNFEFDDDNEEVASTKMKTRRTNEWKKKKKESDEEYDFENEEEEEENDDNDDIDDDKKSLVQRVKERYMKEKIRNRRNHGRKQARKYNLRKRNKKKSYKEYDDEEEEEETEQYDDEIQTKKNSTIDDGEEEEEEENNSEYSSESYEEENIKNKNIKKGIINKQRNKKFDDSEDDDESDLVVTLNQKKKSPPIDHKKTKEKKKGFSPDFAVFSDEDNYYDFAKLNIPDIFADDSFSSHSSVNKDHILNKGVVFYFDKLDDNNDKEYINNYFGSESNMLYLDQNLLTDFLANKPQFARNFSNK